MIGMGSSMLAAIAPEAALAVFGAVIGCGMIVIGAGVGIGLIGSKSVESVARQPEAANRIFTTMIVSAALIEGVTLFALVLCAVIIFGGK